MINPQTLKSSDFERHNLECVKTGDTVDFYWGMGTSYISKEELIHLLKGGVLADYSSMEYAFFYKLDDEALKFAQNILKASEE